MEAFRITRKQARYGHTIVHVQKLDEETEWPASDDKAFMRHLGANAGCGGMTLAGGEENTRIYKVWGCD